MPDKHEFVRESDGHHRVHFDSVSEFIEYAVSGEGNSPSNQKHSEDRIGEMDARNSEGGMTGRFYHGFNRDKMLETIEEPPDKLVMEVSRLKAEIEAEIEAPVEPRRRYVHNLDCGDELDPHAWLMRDPEGWSEMRRVFVTKSVIRIAVNVSCHCGRRPADLLFRGAAAAALADALDEQGHSVEVTAFGCTSGKSPDVPRRERHITSVTVKAADAPMDVARIAFCLSEIAFYRTVVMNAATRALPAEHRVSSGHGNTQPLPERDRKLADVLLDSDILSRDAAVAALKKYADMSTQETPG